MKVRLKTSGGIAGGQEFEPVERRTLESELPRESIELLESLALTEDVPHDPAEGARVRGSEEVRTEKQVFEIEIMREDGTSKFYNWHDVTLEKDRRLGRLVNAILRVSKPVSKE